MSTKLTEEENQALFNFPCEFPFKVMGLTHDSFKAEITAIIKKHVPSLKESAVSVKPSKNGTYTALTATFIAESREQLDNLYREVTVHPSVKMVL
jgi:putative lipoic acid-binding regulatory protein